jgi:hypothetical protein
MYALDHTGVFLVFSEVHFYAATYLYAFEEVVGNFPGVVFRQGQRYNDFSEHGEQK